MAVGRRKFRPVARRKLIWARTPVTSFVVSPGPGAGTAVDLLAPFRALGGATQGCTVTRVRLTYAWGSSTTSDVTGAMTGVVVDQLQADLTEVPRPSVEPHADWMHWGFESVWHETTFLSGPEARLSRHIDVQAQRKLEELGQTLYWVIEDSDPSVGGTIGTVSYAASVLLRLP